ncbi:MAG: hypothetical protein E7614_07965 [Ruminococcaceae bacterium]|nr:hypothetical protein [Oscillospiraceae bacterium]
MNKNENIIIEERANKGELSVDNNENNEKKTTFRDIIKEKFPSLSPTAYRIAVIAFCLYSVLLAVFRAFAIEKSVEFPGFTGGSDVYKLDDTVYTRVFFVLYCLGAVAAFLISLFSHKITYGANKRSNSFVFVSSLAGFCMVGCAGFFVYRMGLIEAEFSKLNYWIIIFMLLTGTFFAMDAVGFITKKTKPWFNVGVVIFSVLRVLSDFIELHGKQNVSSNEYHIVSLTALLIFFCCNSRLHIYGSANIWFRFFGLFAALSTIIYALPEIYISLFEPYYVDSIFIFCIVDAVLAFYVLTKLLSIRSIKENVSESVGEKE